MNRIQNLFRTGAWLALVGALTALLVLLFRAASGGGLAPYAGPLVGTAGQVSSQPLPATETVAVIGTLPPFPPTATAPPVPTPLPTPVVTPVFTSMPPVIPLSTGQAPESYTIIAREGSVLRVIQSDGASGHVLLDVRAELPLFLAGGDTNNRVWGSSSPDGKQLALVLSNVETQDALAKGESPHYTIYLFEIATGNLLPLVPEAVEPAWSPDGTRIAYRSTQTFGLWVVDVASKETREIYAVDRKKLDYWVNFITWSPDGRRIAFVKTAGMLEVGEVWTMDVNGETQPARSVPEDMLSGNLNWSPDGKQIVFVSTYGEHITPGRPSNLWVVDVATGRLQQLTHDMSTTGGTPAWSADGNWIVFEGVNLLEGERPAYDIWLIARDGSELKRLTGDPADDLFPAWTPDHTRIVFWRRGAGIWELDVEHGTTKQLYPINVDYVISR